MLHGVELSRAQSLTGEQIGSAITAPTPTPLGAGGRRKR
jgi:hypothetical protein